MCNWSFFLPNVNQTIFHKELCNNKSTSNSIHSNFQKYNNNYNNYESILPNFINNKKIGIYMIEAYDL